MSAAGSLRRLQQLFRESCTNDDVQIAAQVSFLLIVRALRPADWENLRSTRLSDLFARLPALHEYLRRTYPHHVASLMASLAAPDPMFPQVIDLAAGSDGLLAAAYETMQSYTGLFCSNRPLAGAAPLMRCPGTKTRRTWACGLNGR